MEEELRLHKLKSGAAAAVLAGAAMLCVSGAPSLAFSLSSPPLEQSIVSADVQSVWWHGGWHHGWGWHRGWGWHHGWGWGRHCWIGPYGQRHCAW
jgi:hypothetical protein